jgi:hypothetical protein
LRERTRGGYLDEGAGTFRRFARFYKRSPSPLGKWHTWKCLGDSPIEKKETIAATSDGKTADPAIARILHRDRQHSAHPNRAHALKKIHPKVCPKALQKITVEFPRRRLNGNIYHDRIPQS